MFFYGNFDYSGWSEILSERKNSEDVFWHISPLTRRYYVTKT